MAKSILSNKIIYKKFIDSVILTKEEEDILKTRLDGWTITRQAVEFSMSRSKVNRIISELKRKYDMIQRLDHTLPKRRVSKEEKFMDKN